MIALDLRDVRALGVGRVEGDGRIDGIELDSRRAGPGTLFVGVGGGVDFVDDARGRGSATLVPDDAHAALAALASLVRGRSAARVVGITGSTGKTSTKDVLAALCRPVARTVASHGGHNNEIGVPLTLFRLESNTEVAVVEMGMRGLGQIAALGAVARPDVAVITGIGPVHLELLGTVERVAQAKAELVGTLPAGGTAVVPSDAPELEPHLRRTDIDVLRFGPRGDVRLERFEPPLLVADVAGDEVELEVPFTARHHASNLLAALGAYRAVGLPLARVHEGAPAIAFSPWRGDEHELPGGGLLINDAYNANPVSMRAALEHLVERAAGSRTVAVLGEMAELGDGAPGYHRAVGAAARELGVEVVVAVGGTLAREYGGTLVANADDAVELLRRELAEGDVVLVKASRAAALETVAERVAGAAAAA